MTEPMTVVSFVLRSTPRWAALTRVPYRRTPVLRISWPLTLAPRLALPSAPPSAAQGGDVAGVAVVGRGGQRRVRGGDRDVAEGGEGQGRELGAAAGDGLRRGGDRGCGGLPLPPGGLAGLLVRQLAGSPLRLAALRALGPGLQGLIPRRRSCTFAGAGPPRGGQLARPAARPRSSARS